MTLAAPTGGRATTYCVVPWELADKLHEPLRSHFAGDPTIAVIVEQRAQERRGNGERRAAPAQPPAAGERRQIRAAEGRRVADRRASAMLVAPLAGLPRRARPYADRLVFLERLEPSTEELQDRDTAHQVARFQAGDLEAFTVLYMRYFDRVYNYLRVAYGDPHAAEDSTQQVFAKVLEALPRYERRPGKVFRAWLFVIVRNEAITELGKRGRVDLVGDEVDLEERRPQGDPGEALTNALSWVSDRDLLFLVERLPLPQRQVLMLRFMLDLDSRRIAEILNLSSENVRILQHRALRFLEERLTALGRAPSKGERSAKMGRWRKQNSVLRARRFALGTRPGATSRRPGARLL